MKSLDRAATAALSLTGVVVATAVAVAFTAAARSPEVPAAGGDRIALVSPRPSFTPEDVEPSPDQAANESATPSGPTASAAPAISKVQASNSGTSANRRSGSNTRGTPAARLPASRPVAAAAAVDTRGDGSPEDSDNDNPPGDTRGDGTPEDDDDDDDSDDEDHSGHRGGDDDDEKSNSGPGNYEHPGRSNSGGDDD